MLYSKWTDSVGLPLIKSLTLWEYWPSMGTKRLIEFGSAPWGVGMLIRRLAHNLRAPRKLKVTSWSVAECAVLNLLGHRLPAMDLLLFNQGRMQALYGDKERPKEFGWSKSWLAMKI